MARKSISTTFKKIDQFDQGVSMRVSKQEATLTSCLGACCSIPLFVITLIYMVQRYEAMVGYLDSNIQQVYKADTLKVNTINLGEDSSDFQFRLLVEFYDQNVGGYPQDLEKIGDLKIYIFDYLYEPSTHTDVRQLKPL